MYAVIETGGKQYRVEVGTELEVELLDVEPGKTITLDRVLLVADGDDAAIGRPLVDDAAVSAEVVRQARGEKLISFKYRPKARSRVKKGHRQELTVLRISDIVLGGKSAAEDAARPRPTPRPSASASRRPRRSRPPRTPSSPRSSPPASEAAPTKAPRPTAKADAGEGRRRRPPAETLRRPQGQGRRPARRDGQGQAGGQGRGEGGREGRRPRPRRPRPPRPRRRSRAAEAARTKKDE